MSGTQPEGRRFGVPEGRTERLERMVRSEFPDGTAVDSEPVQVAQGAALTWAGIADSFRKMKEPPGTTRRVFTRTVVVEAGPWTEVVLPAEKRESVGPWVAAACGCVWRESRPDGVRLDPTAPRACVTHKADHPASVRASSQGMAMVPVTYHDADPSAATAPVISEVKA